MAMRNLNKFSRLLQPRGSMPPISKTSKTPWKSSENLVKYGFIQKTSSGMYAFLPLGMRVLNKLIMVVDSEMGKIGAQKILLPALTSTNLWRKTKRYSANNAELFEVQDRANRNYILSPTHEEAICSLISSIGVLSTKMFPLKLYQISQKWRDEMKPRYGFVRSREFIMKDLYTFDINLDNAKETYSLVCEAYNNIFERIEIPFVKAVGDPGSIGGLTSHEYHCTSNVGEDVVYVCPTCKYAINKTICNEKYCNHCKNAFLEQNSVEVGHTFLLDTKYTEPLNVTYQTNNISIPCAMGCFGLGLSRIFAVMTEILSTNGELRWPKHLAPYTVCIIPPKMGSKEESSSQFMNQIVETFDRLNIDVIIDDRTQLTIGKRLMDVRTIGLPYAVILGKSTMKSPPKVEISNINKSTNVEIALDDVAGYFKNESIKS